MKTFIISVFLLLFFNFYMFSQESPYTTFHTVVDGDSISFDYSKSMEVEILSYIRNLEVYKIDQKRLKDLSGIFHTNAVGYYSHGAVGVTLLHKDFKDFVFISSEIPSYLPTMIDATLHHEMYHFMVNDVGHPSLESGAPYILAEGRKVDAEVVLCTWGKAESKNEYFKYLKEKVEK